MFKLKYFWPYILFFLTVVVLVVANMYHIEQEIKRNLAYTKTLNVAGRQRMFSQRLTKMSLLVQTDSSVLSDMNTTLQRWQSAHVDLRNSENGVSVYADVHPEIEESFREISLPFSRLVTAFGQVISYDSLSSELKTTILQNEQDYLQQMDALVGVLEENAAKDLTESGKKQSILAILSGLLLVLEVIIFVYPYHKRLVRSYKKVKQQQEDLEKQTSIIESLSKTNALIIKGANAGIWDWNIITGEENWSDKFFHLLGYEANEIPATYHTFLNVLLHPDDKSKLEPLIEKHLKEKVEYRYEIRLKNKSGEYKWYETSGQAEWDENDQPLRMAGSIIDINDRVSTRKKLLEENSVKDRLLSIIAHDLRSPVNNLKTLMSLLDSGMITEEEFKEQLKSAGVAVNELSESLDKLLTWALGQLRGWQVDPTVFDLNDIINDCMSFCRSSIDKKQIDMDVDITDGLKVYADYNQVALIIRNVMSNAVKFTPDNGRVSIKTGRNTDYVSIVITDSGVGMDKETLGKVMSSSEIYTTRGTNNEKGTGLGMSMCIEFAGRNNCKLEIDSQPGEGTSVMLLIPVATTTT